MPKEPGTKKCPKCERWAYMAGGVCEFCKFEHTVSGRIVGREIVRETIPLKTAPFNKERWSTELKQVSERINREHIDRQLFEAHDQLNTVFLELYRHKAFQRQAAKLADIMEEIGKLMIDLRSG